MTVVLLFDRGPREFWFGTDHDPIGRAREPSRHSGPG
jgi:hypothetical protein